MALTGTFLLLLFPEGHLPSPRWRAVASAAALGIAAGGLGGSLVPGKVENFDLENPLGVGGVAGSIMTAVGAAGAMLVVACVIASVASLIVRFRRARGDERQQLKWFAYAAAFTGVVFPASFIGFDAVEELQILMAVAIAALPIGAGIGIFKYRLYDIDLLVNRTLVYGALTAAVIGVYAGTVELLSLAFRHRAGFWLAAAATAVVIVLVQPLRAQLQRRVNRLMYGERDDPYAAISRLGQRLQATLAPEALLSAVVETVSQALRVPYVSVELKRGRALEPAASCGRLPRDEPLRLPLVHQGETVGALVLAPRAPGETFSAQDRRLLDDLARQAGGAVHAVRLTAELQRSRERLVTAQEEERRRIRRDLHDGLGPTLAGVALNLEAARNLLGRDPAAAEELLVKLAAESQAAIADIRRLVYELRPPALDELGLVPALLEHAALLGSRTGAQSGSSESDGLRVLVEAPDELPHLPAAVEVAVYRIALEALTNAARHAEARSCTVRLTLNGALELEISDDGKGIALSPPIGVGLSSMRERAEELGGSCTVEPVPGGGTRVRASLPLAAT